MALSFPSPNIPHNVLPPHTIGQDVFIGGTWALSVLSSLPRDITVITGILAGLYYATLLYKIWFNKK